MKINLIKGYKQLIKEASAEINTIPVERAISLLQKDGFEFIDLRDFREIQRSGKIPGSFSCPRGMLEFWIDPESPYHKDIFSKNSSFIFYCASAWRSALATKTAKDMGLINVSHIEGGFTNWEKLGGPVEKPNGNH